MPLAISIVSGDKETVQQLQEFGGRLSDFTGAMKTIGSELVSYYSGQVFASQGAALGIDWAPLSMLYAKWKAKRYPTRGILVRTGTMQKSFEAASDKNSVVISNPTPYFAYHQSTQPGEKMPWRPMLGINDDVKDIVWQVITSDIQQKMRASK